MSASAKHRKGPRPVPGGDFRPPVAPMAATQALCKDGLKAVMRIRVVPEKAFGAN